MPTWTELKHDPSLWEVFKLRAEILYLLREFFHRKDFLEVFTPILQPAVIPESYLDIFRTEVIDLKGKRHPRFLIPSPEVSIKKMLAAGLPKCFEITKCFRNRESGSDYHNYEFMMLEWYRTNADYMDILEDVKNLLLYLFEKIKEIYPGKFKGNILKYRNYKIDLSLPWEMISVSKALEIYSGISFSEITDKDDKKDMFPVKKIAGIAEKKGYRIGNKDTWEEVFNQIYLNEIDPHLGVNGKPTIIYDYPAPVAALGKLKDEDSRIVERFEIYMGRVELADCCTELDDYAEQKQRFQKSVTEIANSGKTEIKVDYDFLDAIKYLPQSSGIAMGLDRLIMLLSDKKTIKETSLDFS